MLPKFLGKADTRGTPRAAVLVSAVFYSVFALLSFAHLVVADVLLYSMALFLEFGALIALRIREPELRGAFRIPVGTGGVVALAVLPVVILLLVVALSFYDGEYGLPAVIGALAAVGLGPIAYVAATRKTRVT